MGMIYMGMIHNNQWVLIVEMCAVNDLQVLVMIYV